MRINAGEHLLVLLKTKFDAAVFKAQQDDNTARSSSLLTNLHKFVAGFQSVPIPVGVEKLLRIAPAPSKSPEFDALSALAQILIPAEVARTPVTKPGPLSALLTQVSEDYPLLPVVLDRWYDPVTSGKQLAHYFDLISHKENAHVSPAVHHLA